MTTNSREEKGADQRFNSSKGHSCNRGSGNPLQRGFSLEQLVKDAPQPLSINKFAVLHIESVNTSDSKPEDASPPSSAPIINTPLQKPK